MDRDGIWHLSPAYDVTYSVNPRDGLGNIHKLTINGKQDNFSYDDFLQVAYNMEINKAQTIVDEILHVTASWPEFAEKAAVSPEVIDHIGRQLLDKRQLKR
jgi:serine/threonine-protein kinase HipA